MEIRFGYNRLIDKKNQKTIVNWINSFRFGKIN